MAKILSGYLLLIALTCRNKFGREEENNVFINILIMLYERHYVCIDDRQRIYVYNWSKHI